LKFINSQIPDSLSPALATNRAGEKETNRTKKTIYNIQIPFKAKSNKTHLSCSNIRCLDDAAPYVN